MHEVAAQLKGMMASLADVEKIAGALQADNEASRKVKVLETVALQNYT